MKKRNFMTTVIATFLSFGLASCQFGQTKDKQEQREKQKQQESQQQQQVEEAERAEEQRMEEEDTGLFADEEQRSEDLSDKEWADQQISLDDAKEVQKSLNEQGFHVGNVDGLIGPKTQEGLKNFQEKQNLQASGELNQETIEALGVDVDLKQAQQEGQKKSEQQKQESDEKEEGGFFN